MWWMYQRTQHQGITIVYTLPIKSSGAGRHTRFYIYSITGKREGLKVMKSNMKTGGVSLP